MPRRAPARATGRFRAFRDSVGVLRVIPWLFVAAAWGYFSSAGRADVAWAVTVTLVLYAVADALGRRHEVRLERKRWAVRASTYRLQESVRLSHDLTTTTLTPAPGGGTILTVISEFRAPAGGVDPEQEAVWRIGTRDHVERVRRALDDG